MSVARFIAAQRTSYRVPPTLTCLLLGVSLAWFYKWAQRARQPGPHPQTQRRQVEVDAAVAEAFTAARGLHGSPRLVLDLREAGWVVSEKTVADSMRRQGLVARRIRRRNGLTRQDKTAPTFPDLLTRNFTATAPNLRWVGDMTEIPTAAGKLRRAQRGAAGRGRRGGRGEAGCRRGPSPWGRAAASSRTAPRPLGELKSRLQGDDDAEEVIVELGGDLVGPVDAELSQ